MKYFIIAGERSGDMHAARLVIEICKKDHKAEIYAWGGDFLGATDAKLLQHYREISFMGLWEVVSNLQVIGKKLKLCKKQLQECAPDILILVDFPGFNLRMAAYAKSIGLKTSYYISPKIWAWKKGRIKKIKKYVDQMLVILPFEEDFYRELDFPVHYVGNPLVEAIDAYPYDQEFMGAFRNDERSLVAVLPGSRQQEVIKAISVINELALDRPNTHFLVAGVDNLPREIYQDIDRLENVSLFYDKTYELLKVADVAIVTSGTATLEAAIIGARQVVVYKTSLLTYYIGRMLVDIKFISLVNLIAGRKVVEELIQMDYTAMHVLKHIDGLLRNQKDIAEMEKGYSEISIKLGKEKAAQNAALKVISMIE